MPNDTLVSKLLLNDSVLKIKTIAENHSTSFLSKDSPLWNILFLAAGSLITYYLATRQKKNDTVTEAKKEFLNKRVEAHMNLVPLLSAGRLSTGPSSLVHVNYFAIFRSDQSMNKWFSDLLNYIGQNKPLLSKKVLIQQVTFNNLRKIIEFIRTKQKVNSSTFYIDFGTKYFSELSQVFDELEHSIQYFFETEINLNYKYPILTEDDYNKIESFLKGLTLVTDNITNEEYFGKF